MEVDYGKEKQIYGETVTKKNEETMESHKNIETISTTCPKTSVTPISTKIPWESFLLKPISELEAIPEKLLL